MSAAVSFGMPLTRSERLRRAVWIIFGIIFTVAAVLYFGKASDDRSAFVRWRPQVLQLMNGVNVYEKMFYPNPPILPISLYPLMVLPTVTGAMIWFALKVAMAFASVRMCFAMVKEPGQTIPAWVEGAILLLSLRPILGDLHHGNNNLLIMFLVVSTLWAWRQGKDVTAGLLLGLAITYKVTPLLFLPYFVFKKSWKMVGVTLVSLVLYIGIVPSIVLGPQFNLVCITSWWKMIVDPYVSGGAVGDLHINQSLIGVITRLLSIGNGQGHYKPLVDANLVELNRDRVVLVLKVVSLGLVGLLALLCRTKTKRRDDPRLLGEFSLVVLTMLLVSERSWKHHFVTLLLPFTYLGYRVSLEVLPKITRRSIALAMGLAGLLMLSTSDAGKMMADGRGDKVAQGYGMFLWAAVVLYVVTAWRVVAERTRSILPGPVASLSPLPPPHTKVKRPSSTVERRD